MDEMSKDNEIYNRMKGWAGRSERANVEGPSLTCPPPVITLLSHIPRTVAAHDLGQVAHAGTCPPQPSPMRVRPP